MGGPILLRNAFDRVRVDLLADAERHDRDWKRPELFDDYGRFFRRHRVAFSQRSERI